MLSPIHCVQRLLRRLINRRLRSAEREAGAWPQLRPEVRLICGVVIIIIPRNYEKTEEIYWFIYEVP